MDKQNRQQEHCKQLIYNLQLLSRGQKILFQVHSLDFLLCDIKGKTEQATTVLSVLCEETFWFEDLCYKHLLNNCYFMRRKCKEGTRNSANNKEFIRN